MGTQDQAVRVADADATGADAAEGIVVAIAPADVATAPLPQEASASKTSAQVAAQAAQPKGAFGKASQPNGLAFSARTRLSEHREQDSWQEGRTAARQALRRGVCQGTTCCTPI